MKIFAIISASILLCVISTLAEPITTRHIPAESKIALSVNFDKANKLPTCSAAINWAFANVKYLRNQSLTLQKSLGINLKSDISNLYVFSDGITIQNSELDLRNASSLANAKFDRARLTSAIKNAKGYKAITVGSHLAMSANFAPGYWLAFPDNDTALISASSGAAARALNVFSKKSPSISPTSPISREIAKGAPVSIICIGGDDAKNLSIISSGLVNADAQLIVLHITENTPGIAKVGISMTFNDQTTAAKVFATLNGLKLLISFQQADKLPEGIMQSLINAQTSINGNQVSIVLSVKASDLAKLK